MEYRIIPLNTGVIPTSQTQVKLHPAIHEYYQAKGVDMNPCISYLVQGMNRNVLIDLGLPNDIQCKRHMPEATQSEGKSVIDQLKHLGISPINIDAVILTHLHWDHCGYIESFPNAEFFVQRAEYEMAINPLPMYELIYESPHLGFNAPFRKRAFNLIEGQHWIYPGILAYPSYGHSVGHQSVAISTKNGTYHCCGDLCFSYQNLESIPNTNYIVSPPARYESLSNVWNSLVYLKNISDKKHILPFHEISLVEACEKGTIFG